VGVGLPESEMRKNNGGQKMSLYKYVRENFNSESEEHSEILRQRFIQWRNEPATLRIEYPTRLDRARSVGYRAKPGIILVRQRVPRGGRMKPKIRNGRRPKKYGRKKVLNMNYQWVAEQRAQKAFPNAEVLNSYFVGKDGHYYWYEVILVDRSHPQIVKDSTLGWITSPKNRNRVQRGLTGAARRSQMK